MARAYGYDLPQKVIQAIELDGWKKSQVAEIFQISRNTIDLWQRAKRGNRGLSSESFLNSASNSFSCSNQSVKYG